MRIGLLVTVATLFAWRDSRAQQISWMAQAIPLVTRATHVPGGRTLTEGYLTQPVTMAHADWKAWRAVGTLDLEGLTLDRGELNTGGYGEGYVDRRHPHAYVHELLLGVDHSSASTSASLFAGRGFVPFGSDDPMTRPFVKYPVNHHLAQVLERVVAVGAVRYRRFIGELGAFNGDEPLSPGSDPNFRRFGDSWAARLTALPIDAVELSASVAKVRSPELRVGHGLDQHKASVVARYSRASSASWRYLFAELARTTERDASAEGAKLASMLAEGAVCRSGVILAGRIERTDRPEEEPLLDPFRTTRPASDLHNLGISHWTIATVSAAAPRVSAGPVSGRPFVEVARVGAAAGSPPGLFSAELRYGSSTMWMASAGIRLRAGMPHDRMGRYGAAVAPEPAMTGGSMMEGMHMDDRQHTMHHQTSTNQCAL